jgi:autotransporter-associated beta strand protein
MKTTPSSTASLNRGAARRNTASRNTLLAAMLTASAATSAFAQTNGTWLGVDGNWSDTATWSGGAIANGTDGNANFTGINITAAKTITVDADRTIGNITFTDQTTASHSMTIAGTNTLTLDVTTGAPTINITQSSRSITFSAPLAGTKGLSKIGDGNLILSGSNTYSGNTTFSTVTSTVAAFLIVQNNNALGSTAAGTTLFSSGTTNSGSTLSISNGVTVTGETLTLQGDTTGTRMGINTGAASTAAWAGNIIYNGSGAGLTISTGATSTLTVGTASTTITGNNPAGIATRGVGIIEIQAAIQTSGGVTRTDAGTLKLSNANTYTGNTTLGGGAGGALILANQFAAGNSTLNITNGSGNTNQIQFQSGTAFTLGGLASAVGGTAKNFALTNEVSADVALSVGNNNADTLYNGVMSGGGSLTKIGTGNLTLSGNNTYTGATTISAGTLQVGNGADAGSIATSSNIVNNAALVYNVAAGNRTYANVISGNGSLTQNSAGGTLTLSGNNTYTGNTTVTAGALALRGSTHASPISLADGTVLDLDVANPVTSSAALTFTGNATIRVSGTPVGNTTYTLITASSITGNATLDPSVPGFTLSSNSTALRLVPSATSSPIQAWRDIYFPVAGNDGTGIGANNADPDADGISNLIEYATNTSPVAANASAVVLGTNAGRLTLTFPIIDDPTLVYRVEGRNDLVTGSWADITAVAPSFNPNFGFTDPTAGTQTQSVTVIDSVVIPAPGKRFLRLSVNFTP